jgi:membrane-bound lytic murein transglycosylase B
MPEPVLGSSGDARFDAWRERVMQTWGEGWRPYLVRLFADLRPIRVEPEPAPANPLADWPLQVVTPERVAEGRRVAREPWLQAIAVSHKVPAAVLAAVWGAETDFGRRRGEYDLLAFWATRAAVGDYFRDDQFGDAAKLVVAGQVPRAALRAFADGSTGQVRWFPRQHAEMAKDGDGDGLADIWRSPRDALTSVAGRLAGGWEPASWVVQVRMPTGDDPRTLRFLEAVRREAQLSPDYFQRADGRPWDLEDRRGSGRLVRPLGDAGPAFLLLRNFAPLQYLAGDYRGRFPGEDRSLPWGFAVGLLANAIAGEFDAPPF